MGWETSTRRQQLPPDWATIRRGAIDRAGGQCQGALNDGTRCPEQATEVDHKTPGGPNTPGNLQALCHWHHTRKTQAEAAAARKPRSNKHPKERHPAWGR